MATSPYDNLEERDWAKKTDELLAKHPLDSEEIVDVVLATWNAIFDSRIGSHDFRIGTDIFPKPQIMGFFLHELIPLEFNARHPGEWDLDKKSSDKDLVYVPDLYYSAEIKTSSHKNQVFGNRSYAQETTSDKKSKSGYYITVNFEKFSDVKGQPSIRLIRFGWLDHSDWIAQKAASGQQSRLSPNVRYKLKVLYGPK